MKAPKGAELKKFPVMRWASTVTAVHLATIVVCAIFLDRNVIVGWSLGILVAFVPSVLFALFTYRHQGARKAQQMVNSIYLGEAIKFLLTAAMFALVFMTVEKTAVLPVLLGFIYATAVGWFSSVRFIKRVSKN